MLWKTGKHVLRCLSGTEEPGIELIANRKGGVWAYSDAGCGSERPTRKSITGTVLTCAGDTINWRMKNQSNVPQCSRESKFVVLSFCERDVLWLYKFKKDFGRFMNPAVVVGLFDVIIGQDSRVCMVGHAERRIARSVRARLFEVLTGH